MMDVQAANFVRHFNSQTITLINPFLCFCDSVITVYGFDGVNVKEKSRRKQIKIHGREKENVIWIRRGQH